MSGTVSSPLTPALGPGLAYTADDEEWTIAPGILVASNNDDGVRSTFADVELANYGSIIGNEEGVSFTAGGSVINGFGGIIVGDQFGVLITESDEEDASLVTNAGVIQAEYVAISVTGAGETFIQNEGTASGLYAGILLLTSGSARIVNSGTLEGNYFALAVATVDGASTLIDNSGTIRQVGLISDLETGAIGVGGGPATLINTGKIIGLVEFTGVAAADLVDNRGDIDGDVLLGDGDDMFVGWTGTQGAVFGEEGEDFIVGGAKSDSLDGGADDDFLDGSNGNDVLTGGAGADDFWFTTYPNTRENRDIITDFSAADGDKIVLDRDIYKYIGKGSKLKNKYFDEGKKPETKYDRIIYNEKKGILFYAEEGSKTPKSQWKEFAKVDKGTDLDHLDFLLV
jgi:Ca2+-binding RTX toxin-like protein